MEIIALTLYIVAQLNSQSLQANINLLQIFLVQFSKSLAQMVSTINVLL